MENCYQHDASTSNLALLLSASRVATRGKPAIVRRRKLLCCIIASHSCNAVISCRERQLLLIERLRILASRLQTYREGTRSYDGGEERSRYD